MTNLLNKYREILLYAFFGVLTTLINIFVFFLMRDFLNSSIVISNTIAWLLSVLFAFVTNKKWVFESKNNQRLKEMVHFYLARIATLLIETIVLYILIDLMLINDTISKVFSNIIVIVLNYVFSKMFVFKR